VRTANIAPVLSQGARGQGSSPLVTALPLVTARAAILRGSALKADVVQYPRDIGTRTINAVARHFAGERVEKVTPVAVGIVDAASLAKSK
jgi:hypothetical protein